MGPANVCQMRIRTLCSLLYVISRTVFHLSAEFMLDVIGAGATAISAQNWHEIWNTSKNASQLQQELDTIHSEGRNRPLVEATLHSEFATPWLYQMIQLLKRDASAHWRDPTYLIAKLALNIVAGLFIGFTFFKSKDSQQGTQNKLFVRTSILLAVILTHKPRFYRRFSWQLSLRNVDSHLPCVGTDVLWHVKGFRFRTSCKLRSLT
jgi:ABC-2 type transporter